MREIVRRGHTVGNHSQTHPSGRFWSLGAGETWREIAGCQGTLFTLLGQAPTWFRAPVGHFNLFTHPALKAQGLKLMSWSARGFDTVDANIPRVLRRIEPDLRPGAIALVHEALPYSAELLEGLLAMIRDKGLPFVDPAAVR